MTRCFWQEHGSLLVDPLIQLLLNYKWHHYAGMQFLLQAVLYLVFVITQTFLVRACVRACMRVSTCCFGRFSARDSVRS